MAGKKKKSKGVKKSSSGIKKKMNPAFKANLEKAKVIWKNEMEGKKGYTFADATVKASKMLKTKK